MTRHPPPPPTEASLTRLAAWYLERYGGTRASLRRELWRRVGRCPGVDPARAKEWIDAIVACHVQNGTLDDTAWAAARARVLVDRGVAPSAIPARLFANGISSAEARQAIRGLEDADPELHAAVAYVRRRRLGPYRVPEEREARREKDLSTLCRAGFSFLVAEKILDVEDVDALLALE